MLNNIPVFDKPASDEIGGASEEDEAITLHLSKRVWNLWRKSVRKISLSKMVRMLWEEDDEESDEDDHNLGLCQKVQVKIHQSLKTW